MHTEGANVVSGCTMWNSGLKGTGKVTCFQIAAITMGFHMLFISRNKRFSDSDDTTNSNIDIDISTTRWKDKLIK